jgi:hypothetical protein
LTGLAASLGQMGVILAVASAIGWGVAALLVPPGAARSERCAWGCAVGLSLTALSVPLAFALGVRPGWLPFLLLSVVAIVAARLFRLRTRVDVSPGDSGRGAGALLAFVFVLVAGVALYALRALTEPMWANDYLAIWGFKGKTIFAEGAVPARLFQWSSLRFSHPEYPLGLPFLYVGAASLLRRWDDHAMALLFPLTQVATLAALVGWLRRRGAGRALALGSAALLSLFEALYRGFTTGMAEVPLSFGFLLLGTSLCDRIDRTDRGASRRLALASLVCAGTKNEGLFLVAAGLLVAAFSSFARRGVVARAAAVLALPAAVVVAAHRIVRGSLPLSDFDFTLLRRPGELVPRVGEALSAIARRTPPVAIIGVLAIAVLFAAGRRSPAGARLLALAACALGSYLFLPSLAVAGPEWLVETAFFRTTAALAPLVAAGLAVRLIPLWPSDGSSGSGAGLAASSTSP